MGKMMTEEQIREYRTYLRENEKAAHTVEKYIRDIRKLMEYAGGREITKELMLDYREYLQEIGYKVKSINSFLVAANRFFAFMGWTSIAVKQLKVQEDVFADEKREMSEAEFKRLVETAKKQGKTRLALILVTFGATGIRVSELRFLTVEMVKSGKMIVRNKGKSRTVILPEELCAQLSVYAAKNHIKSGVVFRTSKGNPINRSNLWKEMKSICEDAHVDDTKVFPHNCRHLFARLYYAVKKDIVKLANLLGHASIETTRIYLRTSIREYRGELNQMGIVIDVMGRYTT